MSTYYEARGYVKFGEEDIYSEGCQPNTSFGDMGNDIFYGEDCKTIIKNCQEFCGSTRANELIFDSCNELGRLDISVFENEDAYPASQQEIKQWKKGKIKLYNCIYSFQIVLISKETVSLIN